MATDVFINNSNQPAKTIVLSNTANYSVVVQNPSTKATVEIYAKGPKGDRGNANVGGGSLGEVLNVTNPIGEADTNYPVATSLEAILRDMLNSNERPDITPFSASFGYIDNGGSFIEYQEHQNKFEIGDELWLSAIKLTSSNLLDIYGNTSIQLAFTDPSADPSLQNAYPLLIKPVLGWGTFPSSTTVSVGTTVGVASPIELDYTSIGKKSIQAQFTWSDNDDADPVSSFNELPFYIGKKIRCFTSHGIDPNATNVISPGNYPLVLNHWDPNNTAFSALGYSNEEHFSEVLIDFDSDTQEVIASFTGDTSRLSDEDMYFIIEIPNEFVIDEAAATTSGAGIYSLNDSLISLPSQISGLPWSRGDIAVKYYRMERPGSLNEKIKIDLQLRLDN